MSNSAIDIKISTPDGWLAIDLAAATDRRRVRRLVDESAELRPELAEHRDALVDVVERAAAKARAREVSIAAIMVVAVDGETPILAAMNVACVPLSRERAHALLAAPDEQGRSAVPLPVGSAVRVERVEQTALLEGGAAMVAFAVQYFVPVPRVEKMVVVSFTSPSLAVRRELDLMFALIAGTLTIDVVGEPAPEFSAATAAR